MKEATLIFPHQLFKINPALNKERNIFLIEEFLFFKQYNFHKQKIIYHRASMQCYADYLMDDGYKIQYIKSEEKESDVRKLIPMLQQNEYAAIHFCDPADNWLMKRIVYACGENNIDLFIHDTPMFLNTMQEANAYFGQKQKYFQTEFYTAERKKRNILLDANGGPLGGKWSYDADNRKKFPSKEAAPKINFSAENKYVREAREYTETHFAKNYGFAENFFYPINFRDAEHWFQSFLKHRYEKFGIYEDAIVPAENFLHHSVLSPLLNTGLLTPQYVIDTAIQFAAKNDIPLNSCEGFVRQIIGWREFIRIVYEREGSKQRSTNYWKFSRKIPAAFWEANTGIAPIDDAIKKLLHTGYLHHIERLMLLGNFMLLCEFDPDEVYKWYMELFIDSYDWVMVPNVYGMVQFADGGIMTTKPYISGSNYILKMSDYNKAPWCEVWDGLFWRFMSVHRSFFEKNPRLGMLLHTFDKMPPEKRNAHLDNAENFLTELDKKNERNG